MEEQLERVAEKPRESLSVGDLASLNLKSNLRGFLHLSGHLGVMLTSGLLWSIFRQTNLGLALPALVVYGFSFAAMFAPLHENCHRTAFANPRLNDAVAWLAGLLSFYNSTFFRRYHKWHHRYTQIAGKDPELSDPKPTNLGEYIWQISGIPWWLGKIRGHWRVATGQMEEFSFIPDSARGETIRSTRIQLLVYGTAIAFSLLLGHPWAFVLYWLLPLAVGQPILRAILLAEHANCSTDNNPFTNTRTTLTAFPLRFLMWNMPFHAEHHLYPSIPFHALPTAHERLKDRWVHLAKGYLRANGEIVTQLGRETA
ncbi:fatty acid desaturase family protein [Oscillatoria sp. FACHB-1406]|uniref:fatty acid desaturase family protein n=1 Tax=Oscillatoria sp. FACHB-1406 TaxID=2692846 RepID=UPI0016820722|nr:fatty acid desaturase family protein [Oscillatoria sp. FACHB-1406]MBD2579492.1 fatty acid desaturase family protein [Oscillatoria sp. FACHB-1406]